MIFKYELQWRQFTGEVTIEIHQSQSHKNSWCLLFSLSLTPEITNRAGYFNMFCLWIVSECSYCIQQSKKYSWEVWRIPKWAAFSQSSVYIQCKQCDNKCIHLWSFTCVLQKQESLGHKYNARFDDFLC